MGSYQEKIYKIDNHLGFALAGLAPDARILSNFLRNQCMSSKIVYNRPLAISKAVNAIADKAQTNTQQYGRRPYGVGLIIIGHDQTGPHLYEFLPSGSVLEYVGTAIGARSQAARTYLERSFEQFPDSSLEELIVHGLNALRDTLAQDKELTEKNTTIAYVSEGGNFTHLNGDDVTEWLQRLDSVSRSTGSNATATAATAETSTETAPESSSADSNTTDAAATGDSNDGPSASNDTMDTTE